MIQKIDWLLIGEVVYAIFVFFVCVRIIYDTRTSSKAFAYLLLTVFLPVVGIIIYFLVGLNYRKTVLYSKKLFEDEQIRQRIRNEIESATEQTLKLGSPGIRQNKELAYLLLNDNVSPLTAGNEVKLLINGEETFPEILKALRNAKKHIHLEYYIYENDTIGNAIKDVLIEKAREGVQVRVIYDDFGSRSIRRNIIPELRAAGVEAYPFYKILFIALANRLNYRNHRKIIVIDGCTAFTGGINISDRYQNTGNNKLYWRDTHLRMDGPGCYYLQYIFLCDWNFCTDKPLTPTREFFNIEPLPHGKAVIQIASSGPDSKLPTILFSILQAINLAEKEILITTPYFIPGDSLMDALIVAALSGVKIKLLVPGVSDSLIVNTAASSFYEELLDVGVEIYQYEKGFIHAKTLVADGLLSTIGTANMDLRSFELNFEVNAYVYDRDFSEQLRNVFYEDIRHARQIQREQWSQRSMARKMMEKVVRMLSPLL